MSREGTYEIALVVPAPGEQRSSILEVFRESVDASRSLPGFVGGRVLADTCDCRCLHLVTEWSSEEDVSRFAKSPHVLGILAASDLAELPPRFRVARVERTNLDHLQSCRADDCDSGGDNDSDPFAHSHHDDKRRHGPQEAHAEPGKTAEPIDMALFAASVAHEVNNPLACVLHRLEGLNLDVLDLFSAVNRYAKQVAECLGPERLLEIGGRAAEGIFVAKLGDVLDHVDAVQAGAIHIRNIARNLGRFSRVPDDQMAPVSLTDALDTALAMAEPEIAHRARVVKDYGDVSRVSASEAKLAQVFLNLLVNAAHAIDEGDVEHNEIRVRTWSEHGMVCAAISDTGKGIPPENVDKIFDPFFTTKQFGVGSGLGLPISRDIIAGYDGTLEVRSKCDAGATFTIRIPDRERTATRKPTAVGTGVSTTVRGRILLVEDEDVVRQMTARVLKDHEIIEAETGTAAMEILEGDQTFDAIVCDLTLPDTSGVDLHKWLTEQHPRLAKRVVFVTGGVSNDRDHEYLARVDNLTLSKPFDIASFRATVGKLVRHVKLPKVSHRGMKSFSKALNQPGHRMKMERKHD